LIAVEKFLGMKSDTLLVLTWAFGLFAILLHLL